MTETPAERTSAALLVDELARRFAPSERTVPAMLVRQAERYADRPLVAAGGRYLDLRADARRSREIRRHLAHGRHQARRPRGADLLQPARFLRAFSAAPGSARCAVPINTASRGHQLQHILSNSAAPAVDR